MYKFILSVVSCLIMGVATAQAGVVVESVTPSSTQYLRYDFGQVFVGGSRSARYVVTNDGDTDLTFESATVSGVGFRATHSCSKGLAPKAQCGFYIYFNPPFKSTSSGRFVLSFVEDSAIVVDLWGTGI